MSYISACIKYNNELKTALPMFSGSGYTTSLLRTLPNVWTWKELKIAVVNRKFNMRHLWFHMSNSLRSSLVLLPDPENMAIAVRISLLLCIQAEICVIYFRLMAAIFNFQPTQTSNSIHLCLSVLPDHEKLGYSRWKFVAIAYRSWDVRYVTSTSG